jgi:hypothetical protein
MTKEITVDTKAKPPSKSILEVANERREEMEAAHTAREKPRLDFLKSGKGNAKEFFDIDSNAAELEQFTGKQVHEEVEDLSESAREKWLRTGDVPDVKPNGAAKKKAEQAAKLEPPVRPQLADFRKDGEIDHEGYEAALDRYEQEKTTFDKAQTDAKSAASNKEEKLTPEQLAQLDQESKEVLTEVEKESETWHTEPAHAEAMKTFPQRWQQMEASLTPEQKATVDFSRKALGNTISPELNRFVLNAMARTKNMGAVYVELLREPGLLWKMNDDWTRSSNWQNDPAALKLRIGTDKVIRHMLKLFDRRAGGVGSAAARKLTSAGRPPIEAGGGGSSPADDGSSDAAWRRKDLTSSEKGELYRERKNQEEIDNRRKKYARPSRRR